MSISLAISIIAVHDQDVALTFYRDALGLKVTNDVKFEEYRWLTVSSPDQPEVEVLLEQVGMGKEGDTAALAELLAKGSLNAIIFRVDNLDATFDRLQSAGFEVLQEPIDQNYGVRDCSFRDPSGNMVRFSQPLAG